MALEVNLSNLWTPYFALAEVLAINSTDSESEDGEESDDYDVKVEDEEYTESDETEEDIDDYLACEKQRTLYILQQQLFLDDIEHFQSEIISSSRYLNRFQIFLLINPNFRSYYIKKIPYSNLLFIAINTTHLAKPSFIQYTTKPQWIEYENDTVYPCQKLELNRLHRRKLSGCFDEDPLVS